MADIGSNQQWPLWVIGDHLPPSHPLVHWVYDYQLNAYLSDDGRKVTEQQLRSLDPAVASLIRCVLDEALET